MTASNSSLIDFLVSTNDSTLKIEFHNKDSGFINFISKLLENLVTIVEHLKDIQRVDNIFIPPEAWL